MDPGAHGWIGDAVEAARSAWPVHPHLLFESLAYGLGFLVYRVLRARRGDFLDDDRRWTMIVAVVLGAALGSKLLHHLADPLALVEHGWDPEHLLGGKTLVGALLGGWWAVEFTKRRLGIRRATGDLYAIPLCVGIAVGRLGCLFTGVDDSTHGSPTTWAWGVDLGDGVARHPVRMLEIAFALVLAAVLLRRRTRERREGNDFLLFASAYLAFRLAVDALKPVPRLGGLGGIQWACMFGLAACARTAHLRQLDTEALPGDAPRSAAAPRSPGCEEDAQRSPAP